MSRGRRIDGLRGCWRQGESVRLFVFARHAESSANIASVVSSDPDRSVGLTARGTAQARKLGAQLANLDIDLAVCTCFRRTQQTLDGALAGRPVPVLIEPGFDELRAGDFEGEPIEAYWSWQRQHTPSERFPRGESVDEALLRYANTLRGLLSRTETVTLLVIHEFALRGIAAAASTSSPPSSQPPFANALPYLFDARAIERAAAGLEASAESDLTVGRSLLTAQKHHLCVRCAAQ
jgi:broad specificity phosphatase PhoE